MKKFIILALVSFSQLSFADPSPQSLTLSEPVAPSELVAVIDNQWKIARDLYTNSYSSFMLTLIQVGPDENLVILNFGVQSNESTDIANYKIGARKKEGEKTVRDIGSLIIKQYRISGEILVRFEPTP